MATKLGGQILVKTSDPDSDQTYVPLQSTRGNQVNFRCLSGNSKGHERPAWDSTQKNTLGVHLAQTSPGSM